MAVKDVVTKTWELLPSADGKRYSAWPAGDKPLGGDGYSVDFTAQTPEDPVSLFDVWVNNDGGPDNEAMLSQASLQVALADDDETVILMHGDADAVDYKDPFGFVPGITGNQRVTMTLYKSSGYNPGSNHEWHAWLGAKVLGEDNKRCLALTLGANGVPEIALHNGTLSGYNILGELVDTLVPETGDQMIAELDRDAKTAKLYLKPGAGSPVLLSQINWVTVHGSVTSDIKTMLENLYDGCGAGSYKPPGGNIRSYGALDFLMEEFP